VNAVVLVIDGVAMPLEDACDRVAEACQEQERDAEWRRDLLLALIWAVGDARVGVGGRLGVERVCERAGCNESLAERSPAARYYTGAHGKAERRARARAEATRLCEGPDCDEPLTGRQRKWHEDACRMRATREQAREAEAA
jgi:hypothetical protein